MLFNGVQILEPSIAEYSFPQPKELVVIQSTFARVFRIFFHSLFLPVLVLKAGDIELNPG